MFVEHEAPPVRISSLFVLRWLTLAEISPSKPGNRIVRFGVFEVDVAGGALFKQGLRVRLPEQPFQVLVALIERPREVVTRDELRQRLWPDTQVDFERGLNKAINRLREALGDDADNPRFIETVPQRGYRFLVPVEAAPPEPALPPSAESSRAPLLTNRRGLLAVVGGVFTVSIGTVLYLRVRSSPPQTLAVLPLENLSGDQAQEYFADGMTDELISQIGKTVAVHVISRTSVMRYKRAARKSLREIAGELNADVVLEGAVAQMGKKVRINLRLIRAKDDVQLWSDKFERDLAEILALQSEVARAVAGEIRTSLSPADQSRAAHTQPVNPEAYNAFLKGNYLIRQGIPGVARSIDHFTEATSLDPSYAGGHAALAEALVLSAIFELRRSEDAFPQARAAALKALDIDKSSAAAHNALADIKKGYDWQLADAEAEYRLALQFDPNHILARIWYADCLSRMNRHDEALEESSRVQVLDPVSPYSYGSRSMLMCRARRYDEAIRLSQQALDLAPYFLNARWWQGLSYAGKGDFSKSIECFTKATAMDAGPVFRALLGHVYGLAGERSKALGIAEELAQMSKQRLVSPMNIAIVHAGLGDANSTFHWLEEAYRARAARMHEVGWMYFDRFRQDPRYPDLLRRVGLRP
ncbi:MAG TPA: winged helix-turn-helix domain-containing protein [Paludibaculum sp.]|jgi:TolB-like protein/DNA-binding winged helix-turn-helix (wHTH) protein